MFSKCIRYSSLFSLSVLFFSGCAKRVSIRLLPSLAKAHYAEEKDMITLKVDAVTRVQFKSLYKWGLGKFTILNPQEPYIYKNNIRNKNRSMKVRIIRCTLYNESSKKIYISKRNISLPIISMHKAYSKKRYLRDIGFSWFGVCGSLSLFFGYLGLAIPPVLIVSGIMAGLSLPGAALGTIEHLKEINRKKFVQGTMLPQEPLWINSQDSLSWLMLIPASEYKSDFSIACVDEYNGKHIFNVSMI